jgi:hypothetical protein
MALKLKPEYNNSLVKRGKVIFDSSKTLPKHYETYANHGFADLFYDEDLEALDKLSEGLKERIEKSTKKDK